MSKIFLVAWITFKDSIRNKVLYGIFALGLALFTANIIIAGMFSWELGKVAVDVGLSAVSLSGLLIIFFFSIHMVSNDFEKKTVYLVLSRPITKPEYLLGKYAGLGMIVLLSSLILGICSFFSVKLAVMGVEAYIPTGFSWSVFFLGLAFLTLSLLVLMSIAFFCITVTTHPFTAVLLCLISYFIGQNIENVTTILMKSQMFKDNLLLAGLLDVVSWIFPNLAAFDKGRQYRT